MSSTDTSPLVYSNRGPGIIIGCSILAFISTVVFILRCWARRLTRQAFALDDWLCLAALLIQHALLAAAGVMVVQGGLGRDIRLVATQNPHSIVVLFQVCALPVNVFFFLAADGAGLGALRRGDHVYIQLSADKTIRFGFLLAHISHSTCQDGMYDHRRTDFLLVHCHNYTQLCTMPSSESLLVYRAPGAADYALPRQHPLLPRKLDSKLFHRLFHYHSSNP